VRLRLDLTAALVARKTDEAPRKPGNRQIAYDLGFARAVFNWAVTEKDDGKRLLDQNPFRGLKLPTGQSPRRPIVTEGEYQALLKAANGEESLRLFLVIAHETGHRSNSVRHLRWSDFDAEKRTLTWRADTDKQKFAHVSTLSDEAVEALKSAQRSTRAIGEAWIFPSPEKASEAVCRHTVVKWWKRLERAANLKPCLGRGWHSLRRKFATDLKRVNAPLVDLAHMGGWKGPETLLRVYMQPDEDSMRSALAQRAKLRSAAI
jgi:integrase